MTRIIPQELAFADSAPWTFDMIGFVDAPVGRVWATFTDNTSWEIWFKNCTRCVSTSTPSGGVGSTRTIKVSALQVDERFIAWESERLWAFTVVKLRPSFATAMVERATFTDLAGSSTRIDYRIAITPRRWARPLRRVFADQMAKTFAASFAALNAHIGPTPTE